MNKNTETMMRCALAKAQTEAETCAFEEARKIISAIHDWTRWAKGGDWRSTSTIRNEVAAFEATLARRAQAAEDALVVTTFLNMEENQPKFCFYEVTGPNGFSAVVRTSSPEQALKRVLEENPTLDPDFCHVEEVETK